MSQPDDVKAALLDPARIWGAIEQMPANAARGCHAQTHTTFSPNVVHGGQKTNTIPDVVDIDVDIRTVPGTTDDDVAQHLAEALGDMAQYVEISPLQSFLSTASSYDNPFWDVLERQAQVAYPGAQLQPGLIVGGTDARFYRSKGSVAYGAAMFSPSMTLASFGSRFHGNDERIDVASLALSTDYWVGIAQDLLG